MEVGEMEGSKQNARDLILNYQLFAYLFACFSL